MSENSTQTEATGATQSEPAPPPVTTLLLEQFGQRVQGHHVHRGDETVSIARDGMLEVFRFLKEDPRCDFSMMIDLTAVDYLPRAPRFEVVVHLKSLGSNGRVRVKIPVDGDAPEVDSIRDLWIAADWYERECHEMYGIHFKGHPNLTPLLLYDGFEGFPLRKDYPKGKQQPLVPMRPVKERYDYGERFAPVENSQHPAVGGVPADKLVNES